MSSSIQKDPSSFRDPSGFIFEKDNIIYRQVNLCFKEHFDFFINSGCYKNLVHKKLLISHENVNENYTGSDGWYATLEPEKIPFISYPYEWSFDMLKDAALLTLNLVKECINFGMNLKDATPFNIQWLNGKLIFIDTLSFEKYNEQMPWIAYRQFCECFLSPLLLMHYNKIPLQPLMLAYPDGIPLSITHSLLPWKTRFSFHTHLHVHLQSSISINKKADSKKKVVFSKQKMLNLISSLEGLIQKLDQPIQKTAWSSYYEEASQRNQYLDQKKKLVTLWLNDLTDLADAIDVGANDGEFSKILSEKNIFTISADSDPYCINNLYNNIKRSDEKNIQPLIIDLSNPSPAIGVNNTERNSFLKRTNKDLVIALALIHHLAIAKNISFNQICELFNNLAKRYLIIEFVPKADDKIKLMLNEKPDIYDNYTIEEFEKAFSISFRIIKKQEIGKSGRTLYMMKKI